MLPRTTLHIVGALGVATLLGVSLGAQSGVTLHDLQVDGKQYVAIPAATTVTAFAVR